jgi:hypothetical protein
MQNNSIIKTGIWVVVVMLLVGACKTDYEKLVEREMSAGERQDSLFLGLRLGMSSKEFYARCWEMNKTQLIRQGYTNTSVLLRLNHELRDTADMNFYPTFENDSILDMQIYIGYRSWAPWNKNLVYDSLVKDVMTMMNKWYGGEFVRIKSNDTIPIYAKVNRNRRILIGKQDEGRVRVIITDMIAEKRKKEKQKDEK